MSGISGFGGLSYLQNSNSRLYAAPISNNIVSVQPLQKSSDSLFFLDFKFDRPKSLGSNNVSLDTLSSYVTSSNNRGRSFSVDRKTAMSNRGK